MNPIIDGQLPPAPIDAWGAFFEHFDKEIAEGRETQESVRRIHERAHDLDWDARLRRVGSAASSEPDQIKMAPCPFCEGPPCVIANDFMTGEVVAMDRPQTEDFDEAYSAHVWCHECGAQGPYISTCSLGTFEGIYDLTVADVMRIAVERWNDRNANARNCYDAGEAEGLNMFPRSAA
ncbi:Lar family restriction alleviation protein [Pseudomonas sp. NIBR-H-19]|uniref:Lar family restriction alleviation protein n=1 Tax=Pseudomonas sp. NIBR-H-19 TaxID=2901380 RepID=UPI001E2DB389|nr:Lar family restriction alleviation protein [Pseudomonas sp. NIBR-H-19]UHC82326.1 Lar family restriction alleviation protein [Pseudomonas sp. NIBR-H-19]